jgi:arsenate reductase (thioredoxin)
MIKVLFLCVHNSARSQMAEAYLNKLAGDRFAAESAGLEPGKLNPFVVRVLAEDGIDIAGKETRSVFDLFKAGKRYETVVTVCDKEAAERCPIFPGLSEKLHWPFPDPSRFTGTDEEVMARTREVRELIKTAVGKFLASRPAGIPPARIPGNS